MGFKDINLLNPNIIR